MIIKILWYFFIYAFLGWCTEVVYAASQTGKFINRGFLNGPFCPIYGFGVCLVISLLYPVQDNIIFLYLGSVVITSTIEFTAGFLLEKIFHQKWWDYSDKPFNIWGYICLMFSLIWGLSCLVIIDRIHPMIKSLISFIPEEASIILISVLSSLVIVDLVSTVKSILRLNDKLKLIDEISLKIKESSNNLGENLASGTIAFVQKKGELEETFENTKEILQENIAEMKDAQQKALEHRRLALNELHKANRELLEATALGQKRLLNAFPGLKSHDHKDALEKLKEIIQTKLVSSTMKKIKNEKDRTD